MGHLEIFVDSSYRARDGMCQSGVVYHCPNKKKLVGFSSEVYYAEESNSSELLGVYLAISVLYGKYGIKNYRVVTDNIVCASMLDHKKEISKKLLNRYTTLKFIKDYFSRYNIVVYTEKVERGHPMIKKADKLSKMFRKEGK